MDRLRRDVERMIEERRPFGEIEDRINSATIDVSEDEKAALWLLAWSEQNNAVRRQVAREALTSVRRPQG